MHGCAMPRFESKSKGCWFDFFPALTHDCSEGNEYEYALLISWENESWVVPGDVAPLHDKSLEKLCHIIGSLGRSSPIRWFHRTLIRNFLHCFCFVTAWWVRSLYISLAHYKHAMMCQNRAAIGPILVHHGMFTGLLIQVWYYPITHTHGANLIYFEALAQWVPFCRRDFSLMDFFK